MPFPLVEKPLYCLFEAVICITTSPTVEKIGRLGGNFHNRQGSYIIRGLFSTNCLLGNDL